MEAIEIVEVAAGPAAMAGGLFAYCFLKLSLMVINAKRPFYDKV